MTPNATPHADRPGSTALYALSADPITNGHVDIVERVGRTFDRVIVGIGRNPMKKYLFSVEDRLRLARQALVHLPRVTVLPFQGMVVDFALEQGAQVIVKGVRNAADFDYEQVHHLVGLSQRAGIDTHVLFADPALAHVSSSAVKAIQLEHGFIHDLVPPAVKAALEERLSGQVLIGVTGVAGAGKSTLCAQLVAAGRREGLAVHDLDLDQVAHAVLVPGPPPPREAGLGRGLVPGLPPPREAGLGRGLDGDDSPLCARTRQALVGRFGREIEAEGRIDRKRLAALAFADPDALLDLNRIMIPAVTIGLRRALYRLRGVVLLNGALLAEQGLIPLCSNRVILVDVRPAVQRARLAARGLGPRDAEGRVEAQWSALEKRAAIEREIERGRFGRLWAWDGSSEPTDARAAGLLHDVLAETGASLGAGDA
jgi:pantetheine-phosphate adenylyltransferase